MSNNAIEVENLGKCYQIGELEDYYTLRDSLTDIIKYPYKLILNKGKNKKKSEIKFIWALKDINFEVKHGEIIGIIGRNGAGKSTLLKILSRITTPTEGKVKINGRVGSLLEVGTGFHPELTGRENIYLNGSILGMSKKEIERKFDEIVDFAEVEKFLDTPVKRYSSGMYVRLAFAVAAHLEPEILLVDEVLSVGDIAFQKKCMGKMDNVAKEGRTILFVSHNLGAINKICSSSILLTDGNIDEYNKTNITIDKYLNNSIENSSCVRYKIDKKLRAQVLSVSSTDVEGIEKSNFKSNENVIINIEYILNSPSKGFNVACILHSIDGTHIFSTVDSDLSPQLLEYKEKGHYKCSIELPMKEFNIGNYIVSIGLGISGIEIYDRKEALSFSIIQPNDFAAMKEFGNRKGLMIKEIEWKYD